jgi:YVTN family beta-propeller protein
VTNGRSGTVTPIRTAANTTLKAIKVGSNPTAIAITP